MEKTIHWLDIGHRDDVPLQGSRRFHLGDTKVAVFRTASDEIFALEDRCPHAGGPLSEGIVHGNCVTCPLHNWVISLKSGTAQGADQGNVRRFNVILEHERLLLASDAHVDSRALHVEHG